MICEHKIRHKSLGTHYFGSLRSHYFPESTSAFHHAAGKTIMQQKKTRGAETMFQTSLIIIDNHGLLFYKTASNCKVCFTVLFYFSPNPMIYKTNICIVLWISKVIKDYQMVFQSLLFLNYNLYCFMYPALLFTEQSSGLLLPNPTLLATYNTIDSPWGCEDYLATSFDLAYVGQIPV